MSNDARPPDFAHFTQWLAKRLAPSPAGAVNGTEIDNAARRARDEFLLASREHASTPIGRLETLQLLAAADEDESAQPPQMTTTGGFRVTLAYEEGTPAGASSICVLVQAPSELIASVMGQTAFLWNGSQRFELGQFDADGKAIGTLPAGIEITMSDFAAGHIKLEEPDAPGGK